MVWFGKLDCDAAGFEPNARGQIVEILTDNGRRSFDKKLGLMDALLPQLFKEGCDFSAALDLPATFIAFCNPLQSVDKSIAICEAAGSGAVVEDARCHDLLSPAAAHTKEELDCIPFDVREGVSAQLL